MGKVREDEQQRSHLLIHNNINLHALLRFPLQHPVETPFFVIRRWAAEVQLWGEPPVLLCTMKKKENHSSGQR